MIKQEEVYRIGKLGKAHGVKGEVTFHFDDDVFDRVDADFLVLQTEGILVPFFIEEYRFRSESTALLKLEGVDTQEAARALTGCDVFFLRSMAPDDCDTPTWAALVDYLLVDAATEKPLGRIARVDDSTANVLFELSDGTLIPASDELIVLFDNEKRQISIDLPEGILDL